MRMCPPRFGGIGLATLLGLVLAFQLHAQIEPAKAPKVSNIRGSVDSIDQGKMTITVRFSNLSHFLAASHRHQVIYSADTKFLFGHSNDNRPGSLDQVKHNFFISCLGTYKVGKPQLMATECVYRNTK